MPTRLSALVAKFGGACEYETDPELHRLAPLQRAGAQELSFLTSEKYWPQLVKSQAAAVILHPQYAQQARALKLKSAFWWHDNPYLAYAKVSQHFQQLVFSSVTPHIHASAVVADSAQLGEQIHIDAQACIGERVVIGRNVRIGAGTVIGDDCVIGEGSWLHAKVTLYPGTQIGQHCIIHSGAVIGADGFGFAKEQKHWVKIVQTGRVIVGDDVEIGANTSIDRGALDDTVIGNGVKLDNQIQIAHNVVIGDNTAMAGCVGVAGSTRIGANCTFGGAAMVFGHLEIADDVHVSGATVVSKSLLQAGHYTGYFPIDEHKNWQKNGAALRQLAQIRKRLKI